MHCNRLSLVVSISKGDIASMALLLTRGQVDVNFNTGVTGFSKALLLPPDAWRLTDNFL